MEQKYPILQKLQEDINLDIILFKLPVLELIMVDLLVRVQQEETVERLIVRLEGEDRVTLMDL